jgi:hypothetical protein
MKKLALVLVFAFSTAIVFNACSENKSKSTEQNKTVQYTCPMHPEIIQDKPGQCPKCGMDLVEKK